jgi:type IV pilus assembly protein PilY1
MNTTLSFVRKLAFGLCVLLQLPAMAEDLDLFVGKSTGSADKPNVLFVLDNTGNWSAPFKAEIEALIATFEKSIKNDEMRVGLMMFTETGGGNNTVDGGYIRAAIRMMNSDTREKYAKLIGSFDKIADRSNAGKGGKAMQEAYLYFAGKAPAAGNGKNKTDYAGNTNGTSQSKAIYALSGNALPSKNGSPYTAPGAGEICGGNNFIIYISNGAVQESANDSKTTKAALAAEGGDTTAIPISPSGSMDQMADEWSRFMKQSPQTITTYTIEAVKATQGQGPGWSALLRSMAQQGGGKYFDVSQSTDLKKDLEDSIGKILTEIQSVNSVFASVSLPVSVNTQGSYLNQVYVGMFRPDADGLPRWNGNLKQYKVGKSGVGNEVQLQDADGKAAVNGLTGFIGECVRSFWTPTDKDDYWTFQPQGECKAVADSNKSNSPDGNIVEKGAQAYVLRDSTTRTMKTCIGSCSSWVNFDKTNVTASMLGVASDSERDTVIDWARGLDMRDEDVDEKKSTEMRPSAHGDIVHSRPVAINYGTESAPEVYVFYGGNDGVLRAINGSRGDGTDSAGTTFSQGGGKELWSFIPSEFHGRVKRLYDNTQAVSFVGITGGAPKPYGMDGPVSIHKDASRAWLYATLRRGGRTIYAFDVTNPASPSFKWRKGCPNLDNDTDCSTGMSDIGQSWSAAKVAKSSGYGATPVLLVGGGYDNCEDADPNTCTSTSKGRKIFVLNADTGALLKTFDTDRPVVGDVSLVPDDSGNLKYAYAADAGGNVYRINVGSDAPSSWTITKIASLGCDTVAPCSANRKFLFGPDVVAEGGMYLLLLGSGDREKPIRHYSSATSVANRFYMLKDKPSDANWLTGESTACSGSALICNASLYAITTDATPSESDLAAKKGWYLAMASAEQVVTSSITLNGVTTFSSHTPTDPSVSAMCKADRGTAKAYNVQYTNAASANGTSKRFETVSGGGLPPSPIAGRVKLDDGSIVDFVVGSKKTSPLEVSRGKPLPGVKQPKGRVYWFIQR